MESLLYFDTTGETAITVDNFAALFNYALTGQALDFMKSLTLSYLQF